LAWLAALAAASCARDGGSYACSCEYMTDYDDTYGVQVAICAATAERAPGLAKDCAEPGAPAPIQRCSCAAVANAPPCKEGACVRK
jgi:hypothetical protein